MRAAAIATGITLLLGATVVAAQGGTEAFRPTAVMVLVNGDHVDLAWTPGSVPADAYRIYGVAPDGTTTLLATVVGALAGPALPPDFPAYAVTGVSHGEESPPTPGVGCVTLDGSLPPHVALGGCDGASAAPDHVVIHDPRRSIADTLS